MTSVIFNDGAVLALGDILRDLRCRRVLLVAGRTSFRVSGAERQLQTVLADYNVTRFADYEVSPTTGAVRAGVKAFIATQPQAIVAVGGGAAIDIAKSVSIFGERPDLMESFLTGQKLNTARQVPLVAIPTTAGSGSEATAFAVMYHKGSKHSLAHETLLPDWALVDPQLTSSLSREQTTVSGLDALCQAIESLWALGATDQSRRWAGEALQIAWRNLPIAISAPSSEVRREMAWSAHLAGKAINISRTTAAHALSYSLTSDYGVPHGLAVSLCLMPLLDYLHTQEPTAVLPEAARTICASTSCADFGELARRLRSLLEDAGQPSSLAELRHWSREEVAVFAGKVNVERLSNSPVTPDPSVMQALLERAASPTKRFGESL